MSAGIKRKLARGKHLGEALATLPLLDKPAKHDRVFHVQVLARQVPDRNRTVDDVERPMAFDLAGIDPQFLP